MNRWLVTRDTPLVIGHRGARGLSPENTLVSLALAFDLGCDAVEIDVHLTHDGVPIVHHDDDFRRCTDVALRFPHRAHHPVHAFSMTEVEQLDASSWFHAALATPPRPRPLDARSHDEDRRFPSPSTFQGVPRLEEVLELVRDRDALIDVELKAIPRGSRGPVLERVVEVVRKLGVHDRTLLSSFDHELVAKAADIAPEMARGVLCLDHLNGPILYVGQVVRATHLLPCARGEANLMGADARFRAHETFPRWRALRSAGVRIIPWIVDDPDLARELAVEVDGLVTDFPPRVNAAIGR